MGFQNKFGHKEKGIFGQLSTPPIGPYTIAFSAVVVNRGGVVTNAEKNYLTTFETNMGADMESFDRLYIHGLSNNIAARTSFVNPSSTIITAVNSPTFIPNQGYQGNGTTSYLNTNYNPVTQGVKLTQNSVHASSYILDNIVSGGASFGSFNGTTVGPFLYPQLAANNPQYYVNNSAGFNNFGVGTSRKFSLIQRRNSNLILYYKNGINTASHATPSNGMPSLNMFICGGNFNGGFLWAYNGRISVSSFGSSNISALNFYNCIQTLGTSIGWAV